MLAADDLSPAQRSNLDRYLRKLPTSAEETKLSAYGEGVMFYTSVPARDIPGSWADYIKIVGPDGSTSAYFKVTYAPDGSVVHVKLK